VTARLYRVEDGKVLWTGTFDEPYRDIFAIEDSISEKVASALALKLVQQSKPAVNTDAYEAYVRGRYFFEQFTKRRKSEGSRLMDQS
jgi:hypothetical protein